MRVRLAATRARDGQIVICHLLQEADECFTAMRTHNFRLFLLRLEWLFVRHAHRMRQTPIRIRMVFGRRSLAVGRWS